MISLIGELPFTGMGPGYFFNPADIESRADNSSILRGLKNAAFCKAISIAPTGGKVSR